jgi:hypothetical protein
LKSYLEEKVAAPVKKIKNTAVGIRHADHVAPTISKSLAEMSTRSRKIMFLGSRVLPVRRADNLTAMCEPVA